MRTNAVAFAKLIERLLQGDASRYALAKVSGLHVVTVGNYIRALRRINPPILFVTDWDVDSLGRRNIELLTLGVELENVKRQPKPRDQILRDYRRRLKLRALNTWVSPGTGTLAAAHRKRTAKGSDGNSG